MRYLVIKTGDWLATREILLSPISFGESSLRTRTLSVRLTKQQIESSPSIDLHKPVSLQHEVALNEHYGWSH